jgi:hypothetical protein
MKRYYFNILFLLLFLFPVWTSAQVSIAVNLDWTETETQQTIKGIEIHSLAFDQSGTSYEYGFLPVYIKEVGLPVGNNRYDLHFNVLVADTLSIEESENITDSDLLEDEELWHVRYEESNARLFVVPMSMDDERICLWKKFEIIVETIPSDEVENKIVREPVFADNSVLRAGDWYKIGVTQTGVHKITYEYLQEQGIDPAGLDLSKIGIFGTYKGMLSESNDDTRPDDLAENAIFIEGGNDNSFDPGDYILFYAQAATTWRYNMFTARIEHQNNYFADTIYYFLTTDQGTGKRLEDFESSAQQPTFEANEFTGYKAYDEDVENLILSGKEWFDEQLSGDILEQEFSFDFPHLITGEPVYLHYEIVARAFENTYYKVFVNGELLLDSVKLSRVTPSGALYARTSNKSLTFFSEDEHINVTIKYLTEDPTAKAWINYVELNVKQQLEYTGGQMMFRSPESAAAGNITRFNVTGADGDELIWNITDRHNPVNIEYLRENDTSYFVLPTDSLLEFVMFRKQDAYTPASFETVLNQDLHSITGTDMVIVTYEPFLEEANRLANLHETADGMEVIVVTPEQIYNEFSSGSQDIAAIRDFMRMLYVRDSFEDEYQGGYLLFFGDASFDYKHRVHGNTNFVPTYESDQSLRLTGSYATDDFFGLLDPGEGLDCWGELNIGIGRFPVTTVEEAKAAVDKVVQYMSLNDQVMRDWRNVLCFIADDGDNNLHMHQAKQLISIADTLAPGLRINKIFSDAFNKVVVPGGKRYPEVNALINKQVEEGALIINYTGHGGLTGWSKSSILNMPMIHSFDNYNNLPLFITASCEFARYDDPEFVSAGEYVFLNEHGGGIALLTTSRLAYAHANVVVNRRIYENLLAEKNNILPRLGDLVRLSKIPSDNNYLNFVLLGDPALRLAYPQLDVETTTLNSEIITELPDTVRALQTVIVEGKILNNDGTLADWFNGYVYPKVYDKPTEYITLGNDGSSYPEEFTLSDKLLFDGKSTVADGRFSFEFLVPKDINYSFGYGSIKYYALDTASYIDAWGGYDNLYIGGYDEHAVPDDQGPDIQLYLEDMSFESGDITSASPVMYAFISDDQGVNYTGIGLGRDMVMTLDGDYGNTIIMNDYFAINTNSYKEGSIVYPFQNLSPGKHTLSLKAWDLHNNSSETMIEFFVDEASDLTLSGVMNFPNPFNNTTNFIFKHNKSNAELDVEIRIFDINGRWVTTLQRHIRAVGFSITPIEWDGRNNNGSRVEAGVYMYQIIVTDETGKTSMQRQKLLKTN